MYSDPPFQCSGKACPQHPASVEGAHCSVPCIVLMIAGAPTCCPQAVACSVGTCAELSDAPGMRGPSVQHPREPLYGCCYCIIVSLIIDCTKSEMKSCCYLDKEYS